MVDKVHPEFVEALSVALVDEPQVQEEQWTLFTEQKQRALFIVCLEGVDDFGLWDI